MPAAMQSVTCSSLSALPALKYLTGYPDAIQAQVRELIRQDKLAELLQKKYPDTHGIRTDTALYDYVTQLKSRHLRNAASVDKVAFDSRIKVLRHALGLHTAISRVQGSKLKASREIRIATLFKETPPEFLRMIVVHELAHLRESQHGKAFYQLCQHMEPDYHRYEFDLRLYLTQRELRNGLQAETAP